jgi:hypothetical protein
MLLFCFWNAIDFILLKLVLLLRFDDKIFFPLTIVLWLLDDVDNLCKSTENCLNLFN